MWVASLGAALLIPSGPAHDPDRMHLHAVITKPIASTDDVLLVPICSVPRSGPFDGSCVLVAGDHPSIRHDSYASFVEAKAAPAVWLQAKVAAGHFVAQDGLADKVLQAIVKGIRATPHAAPKLKRFFEAAQ
jgi:hypothetical protein